MLRIEAVVYGSSCNVMGSFSSGLSCLVSVRTSPPELCRQASAVSSSCLLV